MAGEVANRGLKITGAVLAAVGISFYAYTFEEKYLVPHLGGSIPRSTYDKFWEAEFYRRLINWDREAADPIVVNPFYHNLPATVHNLKDLEVEGE